MENYARADSRGACMNDFASIMDIAKNLGTPGLTIMSIVAAVIWLARQGVTLRKDLEQSKLDSAAALIKIWSEIEGKKPESRDPNYEAVREELLRRFGIKSPAINDVGEVKIDLALARGSLPARQRVLLSFGGAAAAQIARVGFAVMNDERSFFFFRRSFYYYWEEVASLAVGILLFSCISAVLVIFALGKQADKWAYIFASLFAGLAVPYLTASMFIAVGLLHPL
jgi:hypothetical protein